MRSKKAFIILLLLVAFVPYLIACFYALPFADDFCFGWTASEKIPFVQKFLKQYLNWNGRYSSDVLVNLHPLTTGSLLVYQLTSFVSVMATPFVFFYFIKRWVTDSGAATIAALFVSLVYLCYLPDITEGVYWYIGLVNYHCGGLCFIFQLAMLLVLLKVDAANIFVWLISLLLLIISVGFNEIGAALIPVYYLGMLIYLKRGQALISNPKRVFNILLIHFTVAAIASAFVICSPGNLIRAHQFPDRFNFIHAVAFSLLQTGRFIEQWVISVPFLLLSLLVLIYAYKVKSPTLKQVHASVWGSLLLFTVFTAAFIPYWATGILGQHRTMNYVFPFFIILWTGFLLALSTHYGIGDNPTPETTGYKSLIVTIIAVVVICFTGNGGKICNDLCSGIFTKYRTEFIARQTAILQNPNGYIAPLHNVPNTFVLVDTKSDTTWWVNKCMHKFYTETGIVLH